MGQKLTIDKKFTIFFLLQDVVILTKFHEFRGKIVDSIKYSMEWQVANFWHQSLYTVSEDEYGPIGSV